MSGSPVTFTVVPGTATTSGTASFSGSATATATTGSNGVATAPTLTAGSTPGPVVITATVAGGSSATFTETVTAPGSARADLAVQLSAPGTLRLGSNGTVTITVTNRGPNAASKLLTALVLPRGYTVANAGGGTVRGSAVLFTAATLSSGKTLTYHITVVSHLKGSAVLAAGTLSATQTPTSTTTLHRHDQDHLTIGLSPAA